MATPGELVKVIAASTGEDEATVTQHDRNLVVAGLRSKSGRGRSAAKVTARDAAVLLTAVLGSHRVKDSVETVSRYVDTQEHRVWLQKHYPEDLEGRKANVWEDFCIPEMAALPLGHSFIDAVECLITLSADGKLMRYLGNVYPLSSLRIFVASPDTDAGIRMHYFEGRGGSKSVQADYQANETPHPDEERRTTSKEGPKLKRMTEMNPLPLLYVGALLAGKLESLPKIDGARA
jgi:hypothetical protein